MTFNKAKEELKWKCWKDKEEKVLRKLGMEESSIEILRQMDWEDFNAGRRYREHIVANQEIVATGIQNEQEEVAKNIQDIIDCVEDEMLLHILLQSDKTTLQIILLKMWGFTVKEIAIKMGIPEKTIYTRMNRLKEKIKKILKG